MIFKTNHFDSKKHEGALFIVISQCSQSDNKYVAYLQLDKMLNFLYLFIYIIIIVFAEEIKACM